MMANPALSEVFKSFQDKAQVLCQTSEFSYEKGDVYPNKFETEGFTLKFADAGDNRLFAQASFKKVDYELWLSDLRFLIFKILEDLVWVMYQEFQNNDPADFHYAYDTDHMSGTKMVFEVICTDYFS